MRRLASSQLASAERVQIPGSRQCLNGLNQGNIGIYSSYAENPRVCGRDMLRHNATMRSLSGLKCQKGRHHRVG